MLSNDELITTLIAYADSGMNAIRTGKKLCITDATVSSRLNKIKADTGLDPRSFYGLAELLGYSKTKNARISAKERKMKVG